MQHYNLIELFPFPNSRNSFETFFNCKDKLTSHQQGQNQANISWTKLTMYRNQLEKADYIHYFVSLRTFT